MPTVEIGPDDYVFDDALKWHVDVTNTGSALLFSGAVSGVGICSCSRCLEDVRHEFDGSIEGYFLIDPQDPEGEEGEDGFGEDEFEVLPEDHVVDMVPLINAALIVDAPSTPLCKDDCLGLCPQCGANLNNGPCGCGEDEGLAEFERASNPFAVLAQLTFDE